MSEFYSTLKKEKNTKFKIYIGFMSKYISWASLYRSLSLILKQFKNSFF